MSRGEGPYKTIHHGVTEATEKSIYLVTDPRTWLAMFVTRW